MSTLLEQASLVMIPSGYKEDVVYSQIPTSGAGDLSFTRASNGTRINSAGLVEVCPWNLLQQSETFNNASWDKEGSTITTNTTNAPNGTLTADTITENSAASTQHRLYQANSLTTNGSTYTFSCYVKQGVGTRDFALIATNAGIRVYYNLSTGAVGTQTLGTGTITNVGDGWYRITATGTATATGVACYLAMTNGATINSETYSGNGTSSLILWGAQLNEGSTAKPYFPTTDRLNVPRLTYQNSGGGCPSLLLEPQRTNLALWGEDFSNVVWLKLGGSSVTANTTTAPDGTTTADTLSLTTNASSSVAQSIVLATTTTITISVYAKVSSGTKDFRLRTDNPTTTQAFTATTSWQRFSMTATPTVTTSAYVINDLAGTAGDLIIWGFQVEVGAYPTSYIPTTTASATRVADGCFKTGISSLIGQTEGTIFLDAYFDDLDTVNFSISDGTSGNYVLIDSSSGAVVFARVQQGGVTQATINTSASFYTVGSRLKCAVAYKANDFAFYINGNLIGTDNSGSVPACDQIRFARWNGVIPATQRVNEVITFKTRLTNAELASLTTL